MKRTNLVSLALLIALLLFAHEAKSQTTQSRRGVTQTSTTSQSGASKQAEITQGSSETPGFNLGLMWKKLSALELQVASLQKQNGALESQVASLQKQNDSLVSQNKVIQGQLKTQTNKDNIANSKLEELGIKFTQLDGRLQQLDSTYQTHTHYMPAIGEQALSSIPGMQDIANKVGVGYVKSQWENIRILFLNQYSKGISITGPPYKQN
jgi:chromosome segregation ATPase